ncbi:MAG: hypothetical protein PHI97_31255 [Desulfobulbus sp.]|nr:hypothetical protein [Desulfobulbus sp.]
MTFSDSVTLFGLFIVFLGLGLLIYASLFGLYLRLHMQLFPRLNNQLEQMLKRLDVKDE